MVKTENIVKQKAFDFALISIQLYKELNSQNEYIFAKQFIKSATSIGANINEAQAAISRKDFIAKMSIASKEVREVVYWLDLLEQSKLIDYNYGILKDSATELLKILTAIIKTAQTK